jgi:(R,R)-butanediol dehydrogenase / meso-butanediol dehydrogenase / diacetyl reductase
MRCWEEKTMKALRFHGHRDLRLEDVEEPQPQPGWSIVEVDWASICASDIKEYLGPLYISDRPNPITGVSIPVTLGHEFAGRIVQTDGTRPDIKLGDRVAVDGCIKCGVCWYCRHGNYVLCDKLAILGFDAHGGFAERVAAPNYSLHKLPESVTNEDGAVIEPLSVVVHAVRRGRVTPGDVVAIVGAGMIGLGSLAVARATGAAAVYMVERMPERRERAKRMGAVVIDPTEWPAATQLQELTSGYGADVAFDCVGTEESLDSAINLSRKGGRVVVVGVFKKAPTVDMNKIVLQEREIIGCLAYVDDFPRSIALVADGRVHASDFITDRIALRDIVAEGFQKMIDEPDKHVRIIVNTQQV